MPFDVKMPDGTIIRNVPDGTTKADIQRRYEASKPDTRPKSFWQGMWTEGASTMNRAVKNMDAIDPFAQARNWLSRNTYGGTATDTVDKAVKKQAAQSKYQGSNAGKITGGITGGILGTLPTFFLPGGPIVQGAAGGMALSEDTSPKGLLKAAAIGGVAGKGGQLVGSKVIAPAVGSKAGQAILAPAKSAINRLTRSNIGNAPRLTRAERTIAPSSDAARQNLEDAARLGLPYALADASEQTRALAGSVSRFSPNARQMADDAFADRAIGTRQRAIDAINDHLAPRTDIAQRAKELGNKAWAESDPLYREAFAQPAPVNDELTSMLASPSGKAALAEARNIMLDKGKNPNMLGIGVDDSGEVVLTSNPTMETLDFVKKGLDTVLSGKRNALGKLDLEGDYAAQGTQDLLHRFKGLMDEISPAYRDARAAYAEAVRPRTALRLGFNELPKAGVPSRDTARIVDSIAPENLPEAARGYATARMDEIAKMAQGNPYKAVYGSLDEQAKMRQLFPEEGVNNFERQAALEADMAKTYTETLGGSATQPRAVADAQFEGMGPTAIAAGVDLMGGGGAASAANLARRGLATGIADRYRMGFGAQKKAEELAPLLFNTNPQVSLELMTEIARRQAAIEARKQSYGKAMGLLAAPAAIAGGSSF